MISCSDEHEVIVTERLANAEILKRFEHLSVALGPLHAKALDIGELKGS